VRCPNCKHENPEGSKFCNNCGSRLDQAIQQDPAPPAAGPLSNLIPTEYAARLEAARATQAMVGERRIVTMLFCDIAGSTSAAEQFDPEDWAEIINQAFEIMIRPVLKYEGTVARLMGDAILAFFGAPIAHEDDPQRAILAGLEIAAAFQPYRRRVLERWQVDFDVRVGINTGLVMVGQVGSDMQMEYTALGDAINLAARMEQTAVPGTVQVSEETHRLAAPLFAWQPLDPVQLKGKSEAVRTYRPLHPKQLTVNLRGLEGIDSPLTGRDVEWERLQAAARTVMAGSGQVVFLVGEAGLGKSRLIRELKSSMAGLPWHETAALSYETGQPYALFRRLLRRFWELGRDAGDLASLAWLVKEDDQRQAASFLLGGEETDGGHSLEGENLKRSVFNLVEQEILRLVAQHPTVLVFDDLHWSDPASAELLQRLLILSEQVPLLLLCALRQDVGTPGWATVEAARREHGARLTEIHLAPFGQAETRSLVNNLLPVSQLPEKLQRQILSKTDGNPFFIEEVVRTLIEDGVLVRGERAGEKTWLVVKQEGEIEIPGSLQALLTARIDRLALQARQTLQLASVIGRTFFLRVLKAIHEANERVEENMKALVQAEMVLEAAGAPEVEYMFRHALTQETAYGTLLRRERREYHLRVGEAMEALFPGQQQELAPILAFHFREAGDPRALAYGIAAGDAAFHLFAVAEAAGHYRQAMEMLETAQVSQPGQETYVHVHLRLGRCLELQSDYGAALQVYNRLEQTARKTGDRPVLLAALLARGTALAIPTPHQDTRAAQRSVDEALDLAAALGDRESTARLAWVSMLIRNFGGDMLGGIPFGERAADLAREQGLQDLLAYALQDLGLAYTSAGNLVRSDETLLEANALWKELRNLPMMAESKAQLVYSRVAQGDYETALAYSREAYGISHSIENLWGEVTSMVFNPLVYIALGEVDTLFTFLEEMDEKANAVQHPGRIAQQFYLAWIHDLLGAFDRALEAAREGHRRSLAFPPFHPLSQSMLARQLIRRGDLAAAHVELQEASMPGKRSTLRISDLYVDLAQAEYWIAAGNLPAAQETLDILMDKLAASDTVYFLPDALLLEAGLLEIQGNKDAYRAVLERARDAAEAVRKRSLLWRILALLGDLEGARIEAKAILERIPEAELRQVFRQTAGRFGVEI